MRTRLHASVRAACHVLGLVALVSAYTPSTVLADVSGGVVTGGSGVISQQGNVTTINQSSDTLRLNWDTFDIQRGHTVEFKQPSSSALAINQILDTNGTRILGQLIANGQVWLINPNGVFFGQSAQVDVGSLLASTLNPLSASAEEAVLGKGGAGSVINQGRIRAARGGYVALIGNTVSNQGSIQADAGTIALVAGSQVTLSFLDNQLYKINVDESKLTALAENRQLLRANGGQVFLTAGAKNSLMKSVVSNTGVIEAQTLENREGKILLLAGMAAGETRVSGTLDASAKTGNGGQIETSAASVTVDDAATITSKAYNQDGGKGVSGSWLIDPLDFVIAATGGNMTGSAITAALNNNQNVTISTGTTGTGGNGDIFVNDRISWTTNTTLTLNAYRDIYLNRAITASGDTAKLALEYGQGSADGVIDGVKSNYHVAAKINLHEGQNFSTKLGSSGSTTQYTVITRLGNADSRGDGTLQGIAGDLTGHYVLGADIDASATASWNFSTSENAYLGFTPLGKIYQQTFSGVLEGFGHTIQNLMINRNAMTDYAVGLFGATDAAALVQNVGLVDANIRGSFLVGGIAGVNQGTINGSFVTGRVSGDLVVGGIAGVNDGVIQNTYAGGTVEGVNVVGGLVGSNVLYLPSETQEDGTITTGEVIDSYANNQVLLLTDCNVTTVCDYFALNQTFAGGLVGYNRDLLAATGQAGTVSNSFWNVDLNSPDNSIGQAFSLAELQELGTYTGWNIDTQDGTGRVWVIQPGQSTPTLSSFSDDVVDVVTPPTVSTTTTDLTPQLANIQNIFVVPNVVVNNSVPINQVDLNNISPSSGKQSSGGDAGSDDDSLYDVIETYGCSA